MDQVPVNSHILSLIEELSPFGTWEWVIGSPVFQWSAGLYQIFGVDPSTPATVDLHTRLVHPEDRVDFSNPFLVAADYYPMGACQFRVLRDDGHIRMLRSFGRVMPSAEGEPERMIGVAFDVTDSSRGLAAGPVPTRATPLLGAVPSNLCHAAHRHHQEEDAPLSRQHGAVNVFSTQSTRSAWSAPYRRGALLSF